MCDYQFQEDLAQEPPITIERFVREISAATNYGRLFTPEHSRVAASLETLERILDNLTSEAEPRVELGMSDGYVFASGRQLRDASQNARRIIVTLEALGAGGVSFDQGAGIREFLALIHILGTEGKGIDDFFHANQLLHQAGCERIRFLPPYRDARGAAGDPDADLIGGATSNDESGNRGLEIPIRLVQTMSDHMFDLSDVVRRGMPFSTQEARGYVENALRHLERSAYALMSVGRYTHYEDDLHVGHTLGVCFYALELARALLPAHEDVINRIGTAAYLHDIGKYEVSDQVLFKRGRLTQDERLEINRHAELGARVLLSRTSDADPISIAVAFGHHRTLGGGGYPDVLYDGPLSTVTRLVRVCDVFEAITAARPYKQAMDPTRAYQIMMQMADRGEMDKAFLLKFIEVIGIYPVGRQVRLSNGENATVVRQNEDLRHPIVMVDYAPEKEAAEGLPSGYNDLSRRDGTEPLEIVEILPLEGRAA